MAPQKIFFPGIIALLNRNRTLRFFFSWSASHIYMRKLLCRKEKGTVLGLWSQKNLDQVQILGNTDMLYNIAYNTTRPPEGRLYGHESWPYIFLSNCQLCDLEIITKPSCARPYRICVMIKRTCKALNIRHYCLVFI